MVILATRIIKAIIGRVLYKRLTFAKKWGGPLGPPQIFSAKCPLLVRQAHAPVLKARIASTFTRRVAPLSVGKSASSPTALPMSAFAISER